jgi:hypothetical protein
MRVLAVLVLSSAILAPGLAAADPAQPETTTVTTPATAAPSATSAATAQSVQAPTAAAASPPAGERVVVRGTAEDDNNGVNLDEIVCRSSPPATGSRLGGGRECHTVRQWNERERNDQRLLQMQQNVGMAGGK